MTTVHVLPVADLVAHEDCDDCICGPTVELVDAGGWIAVHHSLDGRERAERA